MLAQNFGDIYSKKTFNLGVEISKMYMEISFQN